MGILNRRAVIRVLGIEYQGVNGLFGNVLSMLSIAELGIGAAIIYNLYRPLEEGDTESVKSLMRFYRKCYIIIGIAIAVIGTAIIPLLPHIIKDYDLPYPLTSIYLWFLLDSSLSYFLSYRRSILIADQRNYIVNLFDTAYAFFVRMAQIIVLVLTGNFMLYLAGMLVFRVVENTAIYLYAGKLYPYLNDRNVLPIRAGVLEDIRTKVRGAVFHKVGGFVVLGTDNILISRYFGLAVSGIYSNYYLITSTISYIVSTCVSSATAGVGHMLVQTDKEDSFEIFKEIRLLNFAFSVLGAAGIRCVATPLIELLFGKAYVFEDLVILVLAINFFYQALRGTYSVFKEAAGILYEDRFVPIIESVVNIVASILLLNRFGVAGVFMGTIISSLVLYFYTYPMFVYGRVLGRGASGYYLELLWETVLMAVTLGVTGWLCRIPCSWGAFAVVIRNTGISVLVSGVLLFAGYAAWKPETKKLMARLTGVLHAKKVSD